MPPRSHSSSSHSSSSRSSSSSSRSYSSSRSSSSSSSSRSYSSSSSRSGGSRSHSGSSHSSVSRNSSPSSVNYRGANYSDKTSPYVAGGHAAGRIITRRRVNQPSGWDLREHGGRRPENHYCLRHNYVYYPEAWTDSATGRNYKKGYYDEEGTYYQDVVFRRNGRYDNVVCTCEYCGTSSKINWDGTGAITCPACGGPLNVSSAVDEYTQDPGYTNSSSEASASRQRGRTGCCVAAVIGLAMFIVLGVIGMMLDRTPEYDFQAPETAAVETYQGPADNTDIFGTVLWLDRQEDGSYVLSPDGADSYDKKLTWDYGEGSYYDPEADCWLWFNTDVLPNLWQYWYEGISSDYESGWMEYEPDGWYIETEWGEWIPLPEDYDAAQLWHMEIDPADFAG